MSYQYISLRYDSDRINQDVDIREVIRRYAGIDPYTKGNTNIHCPSLSHIDKNPSAHIYRDGNNCYCFSCAKRFTPISIVQEHTNASFPEACRILIQEFDLSMSRYSNIDEVERAKAKREEARRKNEYLDFFPLTADDCAVLGMDDAFSTKYENPDYEEMKLYYSDAPRYYTKASIVEMWECSKDTIEDMLLVMSQTRSDHYKSIISADTNSFHEIYALHNAREWGEASKIDDAIQQYGIDMFSNITLTERQRHLVDDLKELQNIADRIAMCEEMCEKIADVRSKLMQHQNEREAALSKLSVQQRESAERN